MQNPLCEIFFQMRFVTSPSESVRIIGNLNELGNWDPAKGLVLTPELENPSIWVSPYPLKVEKRMKLEFKCVVMEGKTVKRWENFPNDANRKYKAKYLRTTLKGSENDNEGKEFINEKGPEEDKHENIQKHDFSPIKQSKETCSKGSDLAITDTMEIKRRNIESLNPLEADESEDSNNSSFLELHPEDKTPKKKLFDKALQNHENLDEILSVKSSDSLDFEGIKNNFSHHKKNFPLNFSLVFTQLKEKYHKKRAKSSLNLIKKNFSQEFETPISEFFLIDKIKEKYSYEKDSMIFVCKFLPIKLWKDEAGVYQASIIKDSNQFYLSRHLLNKNYKKVLCIGMLREFIEEPDRQEVSFLLRKRFNCSIIFLNHDVKEMFLLSHEIFSMLDSLILNNYSNSLSVSIDKFWGDKQSAWEVLRQINEKYCETLKEFINSEYETILISDYHFILISKLLINAKFKFTIGFYFNASFPTFEVFRLFPFKDEFLNGLLNCDLIYFNCFEQARPFFTALLLEKNIKISSKSGLLNFFYQNKYTFIKLKCVTIDSKAIKSLPKMPINHIKSIESNEYNIILGIDRISELTGVDQKMKLLAQWVKETQNKHKIKLIQILQKPYYGPLTEKQKIWLENIRKIEKELNSKFSEPFIELFEIDPNEQESLYLMSKAKILINTTIKNEYCIDSMKFVLTNEKNGHVLLSEFMNYNRSCSSIFSFNPLKYSDFKEKIENLFKMQPQFSKTLINSDVSYLLKYPIDSWFFEFFSDLKSINSSKKTSHSLTKIPYNPKLPFFELSQFAQDYEKTSNRIFIFEFFGTLVRPTSITDLNRFSKKSLRRAYQLNEELMKSLSLLVQDERNTVYVITSKSANNLDIALGNLHDIGLVAESGYLYKLKSKKKWAKLIAIDWSWKEVVKKTMENYTKNTLGSTMEIKESALVWNYEDVPLELAEMQSKSLISQLKSSLEKIKEVEIVIGHGFIEARPIGISKGMFLGLLLESYQSINDIDFIMVLGGNEGMFEKVREFMKGNSSKGLEDLIKKYLIWVGQNRVEGDYTLKDSEEVGVLMKKLSETVFSCI